VSTNCDRLANLVTRRPEEAGRNWLEMAPRVEELILQRGITVPGWHAGDEMRRRFADQVARLLVEARMVTHDDQVIDASQTLSQAITGLGLLQEYLDRPGVEEIIVRGDQVLLEENGQITSLGRMASADYFERIARKAADLGGRGMKADRPFVLVDLPGGARFTAMIPPLSIEGTAINVRVFRSEVMTLETLASAGTFDPPARQQGENCIPDGFAVGMPDAARFLAWTVHRNAATVLISGEFSSGKTTLLNALTGYVRPTTVLSVIETFRELQVCHPYAARAVVPVPPQGKFPAMAEVVNVLYTRMRPDLIIFGETVGTEAVELLAAMNLGKRVLTTIHANSAYDALLRLEDLASASGLPLLAVRERIGRGVDLVVHMCRHGSRRYVEEVVRVTGVRDDRYQLEPVF
jgi:pilus assembly protein CpaF